jgi:hypothetical protein
MKGSKSQIIVPALAIFAFAALLPPIANTPYAAAESNRQTTGGIDVEVQWTMLDHEREAIVISGTVSSFENRDYTVNIVVNGSDGGEVTSADVSLMESKTFVYILSHALPVGHYDVTVSYHNHAAKTSFDVKL